MAHSAAAGAQADADFPTLVSPAWLQQRLGSVKVLDGTWFLPNAGRDAWAEHKAGRIPGAIFFGASLCRGGAGRSWHPDSARFGHMFAPDSVLL